MSDVVINLFIVGYLVAALRQHWAMFAPDPSPYSMRCYAVIRFASGGAMRWDPERFDHSRLAAWLGFRRRLFEMMIATVGGQIAARSLAAYLAATYRREGDEPLEVVIVRVATPLDRTAATESIVGQFPIGTLVAAPERGR